MRPPATSARRSFVSGLGAFAAALALGGRRVEGQAGTTSPFTPRRHPQDAWLDVPGQHRVLFDVTSADGMGDILRFVSNTFTANKAAYGIDQGDLAVVVILRHSATSFGYGDGVWARHGKALAGITRYRDAAGGEPPKANPYNGAPRNVFDELVKRGVRIGVCDTASHGVARTLAGAGDAEATYKEMIADMVPSSRLVPAGVVAVARAQEYGYGVVHVG